MIILFTGMSGSGQIEYLERVKSVFPPDSPPLVIHDLGQVMMGLAKERGHSIPEHKLLGAGIMRDLLSGWAFERIRGSIAGQEKECTNAVVCHTCFRRGRLLFGGFDPASVNLLRPDCVITLVDDISQIQTRLQASETWKGWLPEPGELLAWREEEILLSWTMARFREIPYYLLPHAEPEVTLVNLLARPDMRKVYLSYPITNIQKSDRAEEFLEELEGLLKWLREHFVVFDPLSIKDLQIPPDDIDESEAKALGQQTVARDYMLIDQIDYVVAFYPITERSFGVGAEMRYAMETGKTVFARIKERSPFIGEFADKAFGSTKELMDELLSAIGEDTDGD